MARNLSLVDETVTAFLIGNNSNSNESAEFSLAECSNATTGNYTDIEIPPKQYWALLLLVFPVLTTFGNILVCASVKTERSLQTVTNYYIVSLAVADIMVAILVMPLAVYVEVNRDWELGDLICDAWIACDVLCCTASILNLTAISVDRYTAVTRPIYYAKHKHSRRVYLMIAIPWFISAAISSPIALGLNYTEKRKETPELCIFYNSDFLIYSSMGSFYIPCIIMILLYWRIYLVIKQRGRGSVGVSTPCGVASSAAAAAPGAPQAVAAAARVRAAGGRVGGKLPPNRGSDRKEIYLNSGNIKINSDSGRKNGMRWGAGSGINGVVWGRYGNEDDVNNDDVMNYEPDCDVTQETKNSHKPLLKACEMEHDAAEEKVGLRNRGSDGDDMHCLDNSLKVLDDQILKLKNENNEWHNNDNSNNKEMDQCLRLCNNGENNLEQFLDNKVGLHNSHFLDASNESNNMISFERVKSSLESVAKSEDIITDFCATTELVCCPLANISELDIDEMGLSIDLVQVPGDPIMNTEKGVFEYSDINGSPVENNLIKKLPNSERRLSGITPALQINGNNVQETAAFDCSRENNKIIFNNIEPVTSDESIVIVLAYHINKNHVPCSADNYSMEIENSAIIENNCNGITTVSELIEGLDGDLLKNKLENEINMDLLLQRDNTNNISFTETNDSNQLENNCNNGTEQESIIPEDHQKNLPKDRLDNKIEYYSTDVTIDSDSNKSPQFEQLNLYEKDDEKLIKSPVSRPRSDTIGSAKCQLKRLLIPTQSNSNNSRLTPPSSSTCETLLLSPLSPSSMTSEVSDFDQLESVIDMTSSNTSDDNKNLTNRMLGNLRQGGFHGEGMKVGLLKAEDYTMDYPSCDLQTDDSGLRSGLNDYDQEDDNLYEAQCLTADWRTQSHVTDMGGDSGCSGQSPETSVQIASLVNKFNINLRRRQITNSQSKRAAKRERKATKTLAIVLGVFLICWMPFFTVNILNAFCIRYDMTSHRICDVDPRLFAVLVWLGYINSFLNPLIYTIFNAEFRRSFKRLLGRTRRRSSSNSSSTAAVRRSTVTCTRPAPEVLKSTA